MTAPRRTSHKPPANKRKRDPMPASSNLDEDWTKTTDVAERRRIQNRLAQRNYRNNIKQRLRQLEWLDNALSKGVDLNAAALAHEENEDSDMLMQSTTGAYQPPQPVMVQPDTSCYWLPGQNEMSGHTDMTMDNLTTQIEAQRDIYGSSVAQNRPQQHHTQYSNFTVTADTSPPQGPNNAIAYDRGSSGSGHNTPHLQYRGSRISNNLTSQPVTDPTLSLSSLSQIPAYKTPPSSIISDKEPSSNPIKLPSTSLSSQPPLQISSQPSTPAGGSPVHQAAQHGHLRIVRFLLSKGASLTNPNEAGQTILHLAAERGHEAVVEFIVSEAMNLAGAGAGGVAMGCMGGSGSGAAAFIDRVDGHGYTALHLAAANGFEECVRILVDAGAEIESGEGVGGGGATSGGKSEGF